MKKNLFINFLYQASYQLLLVILPVITVPVVSNALGAEGIGIYNYINSIVTYFVTFAALGIINYGTREISIVRNDRQLLSKKFWEIETLSIYITLMVMIVYIIFAFTTNQVIYFLVSGITLWGSLFDITWFYQGTENFKKITIRNFIIRIISFLIIVFLVNDTSDLLLYIGINSVSNLISQISLWISIPKYVDFVRIPFKDSLSHLKPSLTYFIAKISITAYQNATKTILGLMTTMTILGLYSNAYVIVTMVANIVNAMNTILIPRMSHMFGNDDEDGMILILRKTIHLQLYLTIAIMFGIIAISGKLVGWFFGPEFGEIKVILPLLSPVIVTQSFQMAVASQYLIPKNDLRSYNYSVLFGAVVSVLITIVSIPYLGVYGAILGINVGYLTVSILRIYILYKKTIFRLEYIQILKWITSGIVMWIIIDLLTSTLNSNVITTAIQILIGVVVYFILTTVMKSNLLLRFFKQN
ncbi:oligosaccharide flippase family protein [Aerococcus viridans]